ncbi:MAG: PIN domain-containing protein, partial [Spirochaetaceae bacterium]|nr:PIN domain-containing protein [Spirochaetaceae bacterium]
MTFLLDTNIVSYCLKKKYRLDEIIRRKLENNTPMVVSPISYYETLRGLYAVRANRQIEIFNELYQALAHKNIQWEDWLEASKLYAKMIQTGHPMSDSDLMQAILCIRNGYILVTHNTKHFEHLDNL